MPPTRSSTADIFAAVERVAASAAFTLGEELETFEREFADWCETEHAIGVSSGTSALELTLRALGIGPGDEVIVPTNSFIATAEAVTATGATPVLVDVDEDTALITAEIVEAALTERTRCVIPVHLYGRSVEMEPLLALCRSRGLRLIEDACQAHGARLPGPPRRHPRRRRLLQLLPDQEPRWLGRRRRGGYRRRRARRAHPPDALPRRGHPPPPRGRRRNTPPSLTPSSHPQRQAEATRRMERAAPPGRQRPARGPLGLRPGPAGAGSARRRPRLPPLRRPHPGPRRPPRAPRQHGVASAIHYPTPIHLQPAYAGTPSNPGKLPVSERLATESCSLPIFPSITDEELDRIASAVSSFSA